MVLILVTSIIIRTEQEKIRFYSRVIEYQITEGEDQDSFYRLFCSITDPKIAPAHELAALYSKRWKVESAFDKLKTHQRKHEKYQGLNRQNSSIRRSGQC